MKEKIHFFLFLINSLRFIPHIIALYFSSQRNILIAERNVWIEVIKNEKIFTLYNFVWLLIRLPEYRSVFYHRLGSLSIFLKPFAKGQTALFFATPSKSIGLGFVLQHGYSTVINANEIGKNVQIWQNVTIGVNKSHTQNKPDIGDNVKISAGAIVLGNIKIGNNVTIGAGAIVVKSVPDDCVVIGNPAIIVYRKGVKVKIRL